MATENRLHTRARVKWPVSIKAPTGIIDGTTENFTLMLQTHVEKKRVRARQMWSQQATHEISGLDTKRRFIPCTAQVVWSEERNLSDQRRFFGIGVRFTRMMLHDREFLYGEISGHF
jgi:hypothetical protein